MGTNQSEWGFGTSHILIVAPHGGAKSHSTTVTVPKRRAKQQKINDLHTADFAAILADALGASYLINPEIDRNEIDLNRITQVTRRAPWFLQTLSLLIDHIAGTHERAYILVVHGWNVHQARCDIGVGADLSEQDVDPALLTVSSSFRDAFLTPLSRLAPPGHQITLGRRYPARHRNNLLQLFRRDGSRCDSLPDPLAELVRTGRCEAVQLELGIPMRWPGPYRDTFVDYLAEVFQSKERPAERQSRGQRHQEPVDKPGAVTRFATTSPRSHRSATSPLPALDIKPGVQSLQFFDPTSRVALLASVDTFPGASAVFGRIALFLPDGTVALYTGEARDHAELAADGPAFHLGEKHTTLHFDGTVLITPNGDDYVDLERALNQSVLVATQISIRYKPSTTEPSGSVSGTLTINGATFGLDTIGFSATREWGKWRRAQRSHWNVRAAFADRPSAVMHSIPRALDHPRIESATILLADDGYAPEQIVATTPEQTLRIRPLSRMSIARPIGPMRRARVTFGPAEVDVVGTGETGFGVFEYSRLIDR